MHLHPLTEQFAQRGSRCPHDSQSMVVLFDTVIALNDELVLVTDFKHVISGETVTHSAESAILIEAVGSVVGAIREKKFVACEQIPLAPLGVCRGDGQGGLQLITKTILVPPEIVVRVCVILNPALFRPVPVLEAGPFQFVP